MNTNICRVGRVNRVGRVTPIKPFFFRPYFQHHTTIETCWLFVIYAAGYDLVCAYNHHHFLALNNKTLCVCFYTNPRMQRRVSPSEIMLIL